jgi:hypothetical protein
VLELNFRQSDSFNTIAGVAGLLEQTSNIRSLIIPSRIVSSQTICSIVSHRVQDLQMFVNSVEDAKMILTRFDHLSSVTFQFSTNSLDSINEIIEWLVLRGKDFTYRSTQSSLNLWLHKNVN